MNIENKIDLDLGRRVQDYLQRHWDDLTSLLGTASVGLINLKDRLDVAVDEANRVMEGQILGPRRTVVRTRKGLRRALYRYYLRTLQRIAQLITDANPDATNGVTSVIDIPVENSSEEIILAAANAAISQVETNQNLFEQYGMPPETLQQMRGLIQSINEARTSKDGLTNVRVQSTATIHSSMRRVKFLVRCINPLLGPAFDNAGERGVALRTAWLSASRRQRPVGVDEETPPLPTVSPTTPAPTTTI